MKRSYFKYIAALLFFGSNGIVAGYVNLSSYEIVFARTLIGSVFLIAVFILSKQKFRGNKKHFAYIMISGVAMGVSWMFLYEAYARVGVSVATLAYYCGPVIVMILSPLIFHERLTVPKILGVLAVVLGLFLVNGDALALGGISWGLICGVLSAVMYSVMVIFNKKAASVTGLENAVSQLTVSFLTAAVFTLMKQGVAMNIPPQSIFPLLFLGIVNTGLGCYLYFSSIQKLPAQSVAICGYIEPLSALIFSGVLLLERLTLIQLVGAGLILGGAAFGEFFRRGRVK